MSRFLSEPITTKNSVQYEHDGVLIAKTSMQGWRDTMEDMDIIEAPMKSTNSELCCLGILDGHGGTNIAKSAAESLLKHITDTVDFQNNYKSPEGLAVAMCKGFEATDESLKKNPDLATTSDEVGSTAVVAFITPDDIVVGNIGDSRCVLSNVQTQEVVELSVDHKPDVDFEKQRILSAGGTVFRGRVCGGVAVSRSFGDFWFKRNNELKPHQQLVTAEPCVKIHRRNKETDEFLVLACDGIFDVMSNEQLRKFIRDKIKSGLKNPKDICEQLLDECLAKGSRDNMSVILVLFKAAFRAP